MEYNMITIFNAVIIGIIIIPSVAIAFRYKKFRNRCTNTAMNICEELGRFSSMLFMIVPFGLKEFGFAHVNEFLIYLIANIVLLLVYIVAWLSFMKKQSYIKAVVLAVVPPAVFLVCGVTLRHFILIFTAAMFFVGHIYVVTSNYRADKKERKAKEEQLKAEAEAAQKAALEEETKTEEIAEKAETADNAETEVKTEQ